MTFSLTRSKRAMPRTGTARARVAPSSPFGTRNPPAARRWFRPEKASQPWNPSTGSTYGMTSVPAATAGAAGAPISVMSRRPRARAASAGPAPALVPVHT